MRCRAQMWAPHSTSPSSLSHASVPLCPCALRTTGGWWPPAALPVPVSAAPPYWLSHASPLTSPCAPLTMCYQDDRRLVATDEWLRVKGTRDVWAIGDCATIEQRRMRVSAPPRIPPVHHAVPAATAQYNSPCPGPGPCTAQHPWGHCTRSRGAALQSSKLQGHILSTVLDC